jgi:hypothetical protein
MPGSAKGKGKAKAKPAGPWAELQPDALEAIASLLPHRDRWEPPLGCRRRQCCLSPWYFKLHTVVQHSSGSDLGHSNDSVEHNRYGCFCTAAGTS